MNTNERDQILTEHQELKQLIATAEKRLAEIREPIMKMGNGKHGNWIVLISEQERESFSLKDAKANVTPSVWEKISAFVKNTTYRTLKVEKI